MILAQHYKAFYAKVFGWQPNDMDMGEMAYTEWKLGEMNRPGPCGDLSAWKGWCHASEPGIPEEVPA